MFRSKLCQKRALQLSAAHFKRTVHLDLRGIFPAVATPFDAEENIAYDKFESNISKWQSVPFKGYLVQGSTGEVVSLSADERVEMVRRLRKQIPRGSGKLVLAGSGCESTRETVALTTRMAEAGADAAFVVTPSYYKGSLNPKALEEHFVKVADASPVPVVLYSVPANTTIDLDPDVVVRLSAHPNIVGMKDSGGDLAKLAYMVSKTKDNNFQILAGSAGFLMAARDQGCAGGILGAANMLGPEVCELLRLLDIGSREEARKLQHRLIAPNWAVTKKFSIAGVKQALEWFGYYGGPLRSPLQSLNEADKIALKKAFQESGFL